ncbi:sensor histidine kinase [Paenibacillus nasutitermitis]|uniref:histidine kinase n=1 Tax=Paenibacillus nasutitermitis TaxID=1652958 RepID=A0A916Z2C5_9BACL|nr:HAMP domain-containing sensor histidine kinase [Paenibacillus nasutitermitis]GGD72888.1 histidine kinase [Paenibacillus nasutitermitis]
MFYIVLIVILAALIIQSIYLVYYKNQIKDIGNQLSFISEHHSFKMIQTQIRPKEIHKLIDLCNEMLQNQRKLQQDFTRKKEEINATIMSLSHDLRTPLTSLDGYLQLAERSENVKEKTKYVMMAKTRMKQMITLVDELFLYTKLKNPEYNIELERIDVIKVLNTRLFTFIDDFLRIGYEPNIYISETPLFIEGNESALERVFENIVKNYFVHSEGPLSIRYEEKQNEVLFHFSNALKRNQLLDLDQIFTRFYKEDPARTNQSSGLGLFIVKSLMEKMNGYVQADLKDNQLCISLAFMGKENRRAQ